jgi:hypothetical protein
MRVGNVTATMSKPGRKSNRRNRSGGLPLPGHPRGCGPIVIGVVLLFAVLWIAALGWNADQLRKGALAAHGRYGIAGTVTMRGIEGYGKGSHCTGDFRSLDPSTAADGIVVHQPGHCVPGTLRPARLVRGSRIHLFSGSEKDVAWTPDAMGWIASAALTLLFAAPLLLFAYLAVRVRRNAAARAAARTDRAEGAGEAGE